MSPDRRPQPLRQRILKLQPLNHLHVGQVKIRYRCPSPMYVESSLGQGPIKACIAFACGDDDMRLAVHEAAGLVNSDFAYRDGRGIGGG